MLTKLFHATCHDYCEGNFVFLNWFCTRTCGRAASHLALPCPYSLFYWVSLRTKQLKRIKTNIQIEYRNTSYQKLKSDSRVKFNTFTFQTSGDLRIRVIQWNVWRLVASAIVVTDRTVVALDLLNTPTNDGCGCSCCQIRESRQSRRWHQHYCRSSSCERYSAGILHLITLLSTVWALVLMPYALGRQKYALIVVVKMHQELTTVRSSLPSTYRRIYF